MNPGLALLLALAAAVAAAAVVVVASPTEDKYDNVDLDDILANEKLFKKYLDCLLADDDERCSAGAKELRKSVAEALKNDCGKCTARQKTGAEKVIKHLRANKPQEWQKLAGKWDPEGLYYIHHAGQNIDIVSQTVQNKYKVKFDNVDLDQVLVSDGVFKNYLECLFADKVDYHCSTGGQELRKTVPEALTHDCEKCNSKQKSGVQKVIKYLSQYETQVWKRLQAKWDPQGIYHEKYEVKYTDTVSVTFDKYPDQYDSVSFDDILHNENLYKKYLQCLLASDDHHCTSDGKELRRIIPDALADGCAKCNAKQKQNAEKVSTFLRDHKAGDWARLQAKWDPHGLYTRTHFGHAAPVEDKLAQQEDAEDLDEVLANELFFKSYLECLLDDGEDHCTADGKEIRKAIPEALLHDCVKCSEKQKAAAVKIIEHLRDHRAEEWRQLQAKWDKHGAYQSRHSAKTAGKFPAAAAAPIGLAAL